MLRLERVGKIYPTGEVLRDVTWEVKSGDRIGLVGVNGAGKSTQLRIIAGLEEPSSGQVVRQGDPRIVFLQQEFDVDVRRTVREELFQAFGEAAEVRNRQGHVEQAMASERAAEDPDYLQELIEDLGRLQTRFEGLHGYELDARIDKLLPTIGFNEAKAERLVGDYSGGWQMRIALGKILLQEPDLLLLDEPTNHLDMATIEWLEGYLTEINVPLVVISHDRTFLDRVCNQIVETERGISRSYLGNYSQHLEQKVLEREASQSAFDRQQKELAAQQAYIDRFRASATRSTQAKSREKLLDKVERIDAPVESLGGPQFQFPPAPRSGRQIALIDNLTHHYDDNILFLEANLEVERGDRIAFVGPNGAGKSTLLRLVMGLEQPSEGSARLGEHNVEAGYFEQNQAEALDLEKTVIDTLFEAVPDWTQTQVRSLLGSFCFSNDAVFKQVGQLSGGEKARLALALMLLTPCNLLVLDEPTNHLDIPAKQMLEDALMQYEGAALLVSHDRTFIARVANRIVELRDGELVLYRGDYAYYLEKKEEEAALLRQAEEDEAREAKRAANRAKQKSKAESRRKRPT
ncbi:ABC transport system ATP-binding/permease protein/ Uup family [Synechococcus sp. Minos11]|uniref:ABC transporter ATP-binding protein n=1 Tax=Synechococcus sp. Minos11 TaxID=221341 RepID=UPI0001525495|nr:ATP-binding cassette domain-containing protein [Synechococcus sp. Minos11]MEC8607932.1 ATP-binding cassette domain-containing protein [Cyanobacteriota bacterium]RCL61299.1 MAG: ATP-binding cassette domain-containing protein [Synechococcus sp. MED-G67]CAK27282.1 ATPase component of ABC transporter with duplicated ATPase domain [Synechococcus sp. RCC307]HCA61973.1 lysophospholipase [Synechococcales bacterium UBA8647]HCV57157.1 lysophospholipase [Synechococcales bacterium UBA12195]